MTQASKTFRIFVCSTFSDLKEERNALQKEVFPKLRELCMQYGCRFQAIDLRWGVREEAALDQQTMKICLEEIARCQRVTPRPNFIALLGDRYGWRPLPAEIPADEFEEILRCLPTDETERQRRDTLLAQWYRRDDNAVPPVYCLLPREGAFRDLAAWEVVERELRAILLEAIDGMLLVPEQRLKYLASATEQEIVQAVLRVPDAREHIFCFFRTSKNMPLAESAKDFVDLVEINGAYHLDTEARDRLERLKNRELRTRLLDNIYDYEAEWTGSGITADHLAQLCEDVYQSLSRVVEEEIARREKVGPLEQEQAAHEAFGKEWARFFVGRAGMLEAVGDYVRSNDRRPLVVYGASGMGKSALMAKARAEYGAGNGDGVVVSRFIGATPNSSNGRALLEGLCREISRRYGADETTVPMDYRELVQEFPSGWLWRQQTSRWSCSSMRWINLRLPPICVISPGCPLICPNMCA
jgi:NACHT domain- and WD repeat-containing protein